MWITTPDSAELAQDTVVAIEALEAEGLFNPFTDEGAFRTLWPLSSARMAWHCVRLRTSPSCCDRTPESAAKIS